MEVEISEMIVPLLLLLLSQFIGIRLLQIRVSAIFLSSLNAFVYKV